MEQIKMNGTTLLTLINTIFIWGFLIGYSFLYFIGKKKQKDLLFNQYKMAYDLQQQQKVFNKSTIKKVNSNINTQSKKLDMCKCGHNLSEHILDYKNNQPCLHVTEKNSKGEEVFCDCKNYRVM